MGGSGSGRKRRGSRLRPGARFEAKSGARHFIQLSNSEGPGPPTRIKMGGRQPLFDNSGTRPFTLFNFQRSVKHYRRHPNDENGQLPYYTSNSIHEAKSAPEVVVETNPSRVATIIQRVHL